MSQKPIFYTGCVFHADILDRVCFSYQYFRQGSIFVLRKILDRVGCEHQIGTLLSPMFSYDAMLDFLLLGDQFCEKGGKIVFLS